MVFTINGTDMVPYIAQGGLKWSREDIDGPKAGRTLDGTMHRDRVATKYKWNITCRPLTIAEEAIVLTAIQPEYITITYTDPLTKTSEAYSNSISSQYLMKINEIEYWTGLTFPVIER